MLRLEQRLQQRYPHWFRGRRARLVAPLLRGVARWSRFDSIDAFLAENGHLRGFAFVAAALRHVGLRYSVAAAECLRVPAQGRLLIVANHPSGALDALALLDMVGRVRSDVKIVANDVLSLIAPLSELLLPVRIEARNSSLFYGVSALYRPASTALLARELYARGQRPLRLHVGRLLQLSVDDEPGAALLRGLDGIVCSHIHRAVLLQRDGLVCANDGDWVKSLSALAEDHDGTLRLLSHRGETLAVLPPQAWMPRPAALARAA